MSWPTMLAALVEADDEIGVVSDGVSIRGRVRTVSRSLLQLTTPDRASTYVVVEGIEVVSLRVPGSMRQDRTNSSTSTRLSRMTRPNR